jgi:hypothetical protein
LKKRRARRRAGGFAACAFSTCMISSSTKFATLKPFLIRLHSEACGQATIPDTGLDQMNKVLVRSRRY